MADSPGAIGIFDSGVGGLTVYRAIAARLPMEPVVYLGDTARVPYGTKSPETVIRYARACAQLLLARNIKILVVACNTASAFAVETLQKELAIPVIGVVEPGALAAVNATRTGTIGVIGTAGTVASGAYPRAIQAERPTARVRQQACPLFVPLAEEGWVTGPVPEAIAERYLAELLAEDIDTLVLGCTHYPLLKATIVGVAGTAVSLVDSAQATAEAVATVLDAAPQLRSTTTRDAQFLVSDDPENFRRAGRIFLDAEPRSVEWVDF